jgi:uncharacterized membrane protein YiaA
MGRIIAFMVALGMLTLGVYNVAIGIFNRDTFNIALGSFILLTGHMVDIKTKLENL